MTDREAQVHYFKQTILIYSTGIFLSLGAVTAAITRVTSENAAKTGFFIAFCIVVCVACVILFITDLLYFRKLVKLKK